MIAVLCDESQLTRQLECAEIPEVFTINTSTSKDVHYIIHNCSSMALSWRWYETDARQLRPHPGDGVEHPSIVVVVLAVGTAEPARERDSVSSACKGKRGRARTR